MIGTGFSLVGEVWNEDGGDEGAAMTMRKLGWRLGFMFGVKLAWGGMGRYTRAYIGVWYESGRIKIRVKDKI
jgi:hypothetical protein